MPGSTVLSGISRRPAGLEACEAWGLQEDAQSRRGGVNTVSSVESVQNRLYTYISLRLIEQTEIKS